MEIVNIDRSGRLVIPEFIRKKLHLSKDVPLLITEIDDDKILIKKLDRDDIEKRLREELGGIDIDLNRYTPQLCCGWVCRRNV